LLVLPSPLRPLVLLDSGNFATSDLNDLYRRALNRNNRLSNLIQMNAPPAILINESRMLQHSVDALFANSVLPGRAQVMGEEHQPLKCIGDMCLADLIDPRPKKVTWSAKARCVADGDVPDGRMAVPRKLYEELRLSADVPVLLTLEEGSTFAALLPDPGDAAIMRLPPAAAEAIDLPSDQDVFLSLHVPLRRDAVQESLQLQRGERPSSNKSFPPSWLSPPAGTDLAEMFARLAGAALSNAPARLDTPSTALLSGMGGANFQEIET
jgi:hypothetical protein